jgi:DNA polymerase-1
MPMPENPPKNVPVLALGRLDRADIMSRVVRAPSVASILAKADSLTRLSNALKLLVRQADLGEMHYKVEDRPEFLVAYLSKVHGAKVAFDIEVSGDVDVDRPSYDKIISIALWGGTGSVMVIPEHMLQRPDVYAALCRFLPRNKLITVNGKFDLSYFPDWNHYFDVMVAHFILQPAGSAHGLKDQADEQFGVGDWDEPLKQYTRGKVYKEAGTGEDGVWWDARKYSAGSGYERIPRSLLYKYNAYDVFYTWHLYELFLSQLEQDPDSERAFWRRMKISDMFAEVERRGFTIDKPYLEELKVELEEEFRVEVQNLRDIALRDINPNSPVQVKLWFEETDRPLPRRKSTTVNKTTGKKTTKFAPSSSEDALEEVLESDKYNETSKAFAEQLLVCRGITKNLGTYVNGFLDRSTGNQVHTTFNVTGPMTGRIANRGAGIMTIPRDPKYRRMVVPSGPGRVLVKPDYGQLEMRLVAFFSGDERFVKAFQPGAGDFFCSLMPEIYPDYDFSGMTDAEMKKAKMPNGQGFRDGVKPISHGTNYGRSYAAIAKQLKMDPELAKAISDRYKGDPEKGLIPWQNEIRRKANAGEDISTPYGFHYQAELITDKNRNNVENSALAFIPQSTGNDICLGAALRIAPQLEQYDAWIVATIHDQIIVDAPIEHAESVGKLMEAAMLEEGKVVCGDTLVMEAEPEYGFNWSEKMGPAEWRKWMEENYERAA